MNVSALEWAITVGVTIAIILFDVLIVARRPHEPTTKECAIYLAIYVGLAIAFGIWTFSFHGSQYGVEFFAGWLTEYSLSIDNLFLFILIMASFKVPRKYQQEALMVGIIIALIFRGIFIALGAVAINQSPGSSTCSPRSCSTSVTRRSGTPSTTTTPRTLSFGSPASVSSSPTSGTASSCSCGRTASAS